MLLPCYKSRLESEFRDGPSQELGKQSTQYSDKTTI